MRLIDADKLKDEIAENYDRQSDVMISCFKCHGKGVYDEPVFDESDEFIGWETVPCEVCYSTGKITLEFYEELQRKMREK